MRSRPSSWPKRLCSAPWIGLSRGPRSVPFPLHAALTNWLQGAPETYHSCSSISLQTAAIHKYSAGLVWVVLIASAAISLSRILALHEHYSAPIEVYRRAFDLVQVPTPIVVEGSDPTILPGSTAHSLNDVRTSGPDNSVRVCVGKEWYRFPSHYFLPEGAKLGLIKSHFDGLLPGEFKEMAQNGELPPLSSQPSANGKQHKPARIDWRWSAERRPGTSHIPKLMNNQNKEVSEHYVSEGWHAYSFDINRYLFVANNGL